MEHPPRTTRPARFRTVASVALAAALLAALLVGSADSAEARFDNWCKRHPVKCQRVQQWAGNKVHQFKSHSMPRTPDRRIRPLRLYYKAAWYKKYGPAVARQTFTSPEADVAGVRTPFGFCSGWRDCFGDFVDIANCAAHPIVTAVCLTTNVLDDGIGKPEKAELICGGTVLITSGGNPVAVGRGSLACYFTWLGWQIFGD
jgi:hypothetical protein